MLRSLFFFFVFVPKKKTKHDHSHSKLSGSKQKIDAGAVPVTIGLNGVCEKRWRFKKHQIWEKRRKIRENSTMCVLSCTLCFANSLV